MTDKQLLALMAAILYRGGTPMKACVATAKELIRMAEQA